MNSQISVDSDEEEDVKPLKPFGVAGEHGAPGSVVLFLNQNNVLVDTPTSITEEGGIPIEVENIPILLSQTEEGQPLYIREYAPTVEELLLSSSGEPSPNFDGFSEASGDEFDGFLEIKQEIKQDPDADPLEIGDFDIEANISRGKKLTKSVPVKKDGKFKKKKVTSPEIKSPILCARTRVRSISGENLRENESTKAEIAKERLRKKSIDQKLINSKRTEKTPILEQLSTKSNAGLAKKVIDSKNEPKVIMKDTNSDEDGENKAKGKKKLSRLRRKTLDELIVNAPKPKSPRRKTIDAATTEHIEKTMSISTKKISKEPLIKEDELIGPFCTIIGCTVSWLESGSVMMSAKSVTNGIVYELDVFSKKISWEKIYIGVWILRLLGYNVDALWPTDEDVKKISIVLKRRKALQITLSGQRFAESKLTEFDETPFVLPSVEKCMYEKQTNTLQVEEGIEISKVSKKKKEKINAGLEVSNSTTKGGQSKNKMGLKYLRKVDETPSLSSVEKIGSEEKMKVLQVEKRQGKKKIERSIAKSEISNTISNEGQIENIKGLKSLRISSCTLDFNTETCVLTESNKDREISLFSKSKMSNNDIDKSSNNKLHDEKISLKRLSNKQEKDIKGSSLLSENKKEGKDFSNKLSRLRVKETIEKDICEEIDSSTTRHSKRCTFEEKDVSSSMSENKIGVNDSNSKRLSEERSKETLEKSVCDEAMSLSIRRLSRSRRSTLEEKDITPKKYEESKDEKSIEKEKSCPKITPIERTTSVEDTEKKFMNKSLKQSSAPHRRLSRSSSRKTSIEMNEPLSDELVNFKSISIDKNTHVKDTEKELMNEPLKQSFAPNRRLSRSLPRKTSVEEVEPSHDELESKIISTGKNTCVTDTKKTVMNESLKKSSAPQRRLSRSSARKNDVEKNEPSSDELDRSILDLAGNISKKITNLVETESSYKSQSEDSLKKEDNLLKTSYNFNKLKNPGITNTQILKERKIYKSKNKFPVENCKFDNVIIEWTDIEEFDFKIPCFIGEESVGKYCFDAGLNFEMLNSGENIDITITKGMIVELLNFYKLHQIGQKTLVYRLLKLKGHEIDNKILTQLVSKMAACKFQSDRYSKSFQEKVNDIFDFNIDRRNIGRNKSIIDSPVSQNKVIDTSNELPEVKSNVELECITSKQTSDCGEDEIDRDEDYSQNEIIDSDDEVDMVDSTNLKKKDDLLKLYDEPLGKLNSRMINIDSNIEVDTVDSTNLKKKDDLLELSDDPFDKLRGASVTNTQISKERKIKKSKNKSFDVNVNIEWTDIEEFDFKIPRFIGEEKVGKYCLDAGVNLEMLNSGENIDISITKGMIVELLNFYKLHQIGQKALAYRLLKLNGHKIDNKILTKLVHKMAGCKFQSDHSLNSFQEKVNDIFYLNIGTIGGKKALIDSPVPQNKVIDPTNVLTEIKGNAELESVTIKNTSDYGEEDNSLNEVIDNDKVDSMILQSPGSTKDDQNSKKLAVLHKRKSIESARKSISSSDVEMEEFITPKRKERILSTDSFISPESEGLNRSVRNRKPSVKKMEAVELGLLSRDDCNDSFDMSLPTSLSRDYVKVDTRNATNRKFEDVSVEWTLLEELGLKIPNFIGKEDIGKYCHDAGINLEILNSGENIDLDITKGMIVELLKFYKLHQASSRALSYRLLKIKGSEVDCRKIKNLDCRLGKFRAKADYFSDIYFKEIGNDVFDVIPGRRNYLAGSNLSENIGNSNDLSKENINVQSKKMGTVKPSLLSKGEFNDSLYDAKSVKCDKFEVNNVNIGWTVIEEFDFKIPRFTGEEKVGKYCFDAGVNFEMLNSGENINIIFTKGMMVELLNFYKLHQIGQKALAYRLLKLKGYEIDNKVLLQLVSKLSAYKYQSDHSLSFQEKVNDIFEFNMGRNKTLTDSSFPQNKDIDSSNELPDVKSNDEQEFITGKQPPDYGEDETDTDEELQSTRGSEGSITRGDVVYLYLNWVRKKNRGANVFVTNLLKDIESLMDERKVTPIRIPAGTLMSSSVKLYEEYNEMLAESPLDAKMYLEEDWLEDIQYLVSISRTKRNQDEELDETEASDNENGVDTDGFIRESDRMANDPCMESEKDDDNESSMLEPPESDEGEWASRKSKKEKGTEVVQNVARRGHHRSSLGRKRQNRDFDTNQDVDEDSEIGWSPRKVPMHKKLSPTDTSTKSKDSIESEIPVYTEDDYEVEKILDYVYEKSSEGKRAKYELHYRVRWLGFGSEEDSWIPQSECRCSEILKQFWDEVERKGGKKYDRSKTYILEDVEESKLSDCIDKNDSDNSMLDQDTGKVTEKSFTDSMFPLSDLCIDNEISNKVTKREILNLYDDWREGNRNNLMTGITNPVNVETFISNVSALMQRKNITNFKSESILSACVMMTLLKNRLLDEETLNSFLDGSCLEVLEISHIQQKNVRKRFTPYRKVIINMDINSEVKSGEMAKNIASNDIDQVEKSDRIFKLKNDVEILQNDIDEAIKEKESQQISWDVIKEEVSELEKAAEKLKTNSNSTAVTELQKSISKMKEELGSSNSQEPVDLIDLNTGKLKCNVIEAGKDLVLCGIPKQNIEEVIDLVVVGIAGQTIGKRPNSKEVYVLEIPSPEA